MRKLIDRLYTIGNDKLLHFIAGIVIAQIAFAVFDVFMSMWCCAITSLFTALLVGIAKELIDRKTGVPNVKDFTATVYGGLAGTVLVILIST